MMCRRDERKRKSVTRGEDGRDGGERGTSSSSWMARIGACRLDGQKRKKSTCENELENLFCHTGQTICQF